MLCTSKFKCVLYQILQVMHLCKPDLLGNQPNWWGVRETAGLLPPLQAHNLKKSTNKIQATKQSKHPFCSRLSNRISQIIPSFPSQGLYCRQSKSKRIRQLIITKHLRRSIIRRQRRKQGHYSEEDLPLFLQTIRRYCRPKLIAALSFILTTFSKVPLTLLQLFQTGKSFIFKDWSV